MRPSWWWMVSAISIANWQTVMKAQPISMQDTRRADCSPSTKRCGARARPIRIFGDFIFELRRVVFVCLLTSCTIAAADERPQTLKSLQHRPADDFLPLILPFIANDCVVRSAGDKLIVRTSIDNLELLRALILQLDRPPRRLLIMVSQLRGDAAAEDGTAQEFDHSRESMDVRVRRTQKRGEGNTSQRVQVNEGEQAYIEASVALPLTDYTAEHSAHGTRLRETPRYVSAAAGFYARPRLAGARVSVVFLSRLSAVCCVVSLPVFTTQEIHTIIS